DMDIPDCPASPSPPLVQGKSPQLPAFLSRDNMFNDWNIYQKYFTANRACELARLPDADSVIATPMERMLLWYKSFRQEFPDTWQEILETYKEAEILGDVDTTVAQHQQLFHKSTRKLAQSVS
ncbi:hypothetical protein PAXRUDRAFT_149550, partial [Paxillus rubicundulus Ve08.2h10]